MRRLTPDLVMIDDQTNHIRVVGELKTPWTFHPRNDDEEYLVFLAGKFGKRLIYCVILSNEY